MGDALPSGHTRSSTDRVSSELELEEFGLLARGRMAIEDKVGSALADSKEFLGSLQVGIGASIQLVAVVTEELDVP